jgi:hypothetical protein
MPGLKGCRCASWLVAYDGKKSGQLSALVEHAHADFDGRDASLAEPVEDHSFVLRGDLTDTVASWRTRTPLSAKEFLLDGSTRN